MKYNLECVKFHIEDTNWLFDLANKKNYSGGQLSNKSDLKVKTPITMLIQHEYII